MSENVCWTSCEFYSKWIKQEQIGSRYFSIFANKDVSIESISQKENLNDDLVPIIIITDPFKEKDYQELVDNLLDLDSVNKIRSIRIEPQ